MKKLVVLLFILKGFDAGAQKIESIYFNLYTDSLKKGVHNYINVDGKLNDGTFQPLMADEIDFSSTGGKWEGNNIIFDSSFNKEFVVITAKLKKNPSISKSVTIYLKKYDKPERLRTEQEIIDDIRNNSKRKRS